MLLTARTMGSPKSGAANQWTYNADPFADGRYPVRPATRTKGH